MFGSVIGRPAGALPYSDDAIKRRRILSCAHCFVLLDAREWHYLRFPEGMRQLGRDNKVVYVAGSTRGHVCWVLLAGVLTHVVLT